MPLGNLTKFPSALTPQRLSDADFVTNLQAEQATARRRERKRARYRVQEFLWDHSQLSRVRYCGRRRIGEVQIRRQEGVAHFAGVQLCGSVHSCPVCSPRIRQARAQDVERACLWWGERHGFDSVMLLTPTVPHDYGESLAEVIELIGQAYGVMMSGRRWKADRERFALAHSVRAFDSTVGPNGWHPHFHSLLFADRALSPGELRELEDRFYERWRAAVVSRGHRPPSREHGIRLEQAHTRADLARYVCQVVVGQEGERPRSVALELTRSDLKHSRHPGHRTIWEVQADAMETGDCADLALVHEWELATKGRQAIRWSAGAREAMGLGQELTDEELVAEEIGGEVVYRFPVEGDEWRAVCETPGARADLLELAEVGGELPVRRRVAELLAGWERRQRWREAG